MCNTRSITYSCSHTIPFRLSTCGGTFTYKTRKSPTGSFPSCRSGPQLTFVSTQICGACAKGAAEQELDRKIADLHVDPFPNRDDWTAIREAELEQGRWKLERHYPDTRRFKKGDRPEKGPSPTRRESLLRREVKAEEVVLKLDVNKTAVISGWDYESWGDSWKDLGDEVREADAERVAANLPAFTDCTFDCCDEENEGGEEEAEEEQQGQEEVYAVMDWGTATTGLLNSQEIWDPDGEFKNEDSGQDAIISTESENEALTFATIEVPESKPQQQPEPQPAAAAREPPQPDDPTKPRRRLSRAKPNTLLLDCRRRSLIQVEKTIAAGPTRTHRPPRSDPETAPPPTAGENQAPSVACDLAPHRRLRKLSKVENLRELAGDDLELLKAFHVDFTVRV